MELTKEIATKVKETIDCGLSSGIGKPTPGEMCIEAAVCYAYGLPHSDNPPCVGYAVRAFKISLNDAAWSSNQVRAKGMRAIGIAQLNSNAIDQIEFSKRITLKTINNITANLANGELREKLSIVDNIPEAIELCKQLSAEYAAKSAKYAGEYAKYAAEYAAESAAKSAESAAGYASKYAKYAAEYAAGSAKSAAKSAKYAKSAAKSAKYAESAAKSAEYDQILIKSADLCLEVLKEMKSPGCEYLYLLD